MATIQYTTFSFNRPPLISIDDYEILKGIITEKPEYNITPPSGFVETFKGELIFLSIGSLGLVVALLDLAEWLTWVGAIPAIFAFGSLFSFFPSMVSYLEFISDKSKYYGNLKRDIKNSNNYAEFTNLRNKK